MGRSEEREHEGEEKGRKPFSFLLVRFALIGHLLSFPISFSLLLLSLSARSASSPSPVPLPFTRSPIPHPPSIHLPSSWSFSLSSLQRFTLLPLLSFHSAKDFLVAPRDPYAKYQRRWGILNDRCVYPPTACTSTSEGSEAWGGLTFTSAPVKFRSSLRFSFFCSALARRLPLLSHSYTVSGVSGILLNAMSLGSPALARDAYSSFRMLHVPPGWTFKHARRRNRADSSEIPASLDRSANNALLNRARTFVEGNVSRLRFDTQSIRIDALRSGIIDLCL